MSPRRSKPNRVPFRLAAGLAMIVLGLLYAFRNMSWFGLDRFLYFWPFALGLLAVIAFATRGWLALGGHLLLLCAVGMQIHDMGYEHLLAKGWPVAIIWIGCVTVARALCGASCRTRISLEKDPSCRDPR